MRSAEELDAELTRTRRTVRRLMVGTTLGVAVGLGIIVTVVGATLAVVDKRAAELLTAPPHKASAPASTSSKVEQASKPTDAPRATTAQAPAATPPVTDTPAPRSAAVNPAPLPAPAQATAANPLPAPRQSAPQAMPAQAAAPSPPPQPARSQTAASVETKPAPASPPAPQPTAQPDELKRIARGARDAKDAKRAERDASRAVARRSHDETDGAAPRDADAARTETVVHDGDAPRVVIRGDDRAGRRVVRVPSADQDVAEPSERVTIVQRPGYGRTPPVAADEGDGPRGGGLFGFIFGRHGDND